MEAEYIVASSAVQDCIAIRQPTQELDLPVKTPCYFVSKTNRPLNAIMVKQVKVEYFPMQKWLADILTKATDRVIFLASAACYTSRASSRGNVET
ncbi:hypothetical protein PsorP6_001098 [Peronosclerospora sorghi]|uniref:Uncharacterized protein n=1 Tax=Peronosclerospora sorghi TaxID=230839 RepID=A0ACC0WYJ0_9STRA|nr:hypothetical protein PsorP6_001098 [Peronosclerospora sorghi]